MNEIKQYKPLALVFYINGKGERDVLPLDEEKREAFKKAIETSKMVELDGITINTFDIKEIKPASTLSRLENLYFGLPRGERNYIKQRTIKMGMSDKKISDIFEFRGPRPEEKAIERREQMIQFYREEILPKQQG